MRTLLLAITLTIPALAVDVTTAQYDNARDNANTSETILNQANVGRIQLLGKCSVDGFVYHQPLIATVAGKTLLIVGTMHDTLYAFDAADPTCATVVWSNHFATSFPWGPPTTQWPSGEIGVLATPVIDAAHGTVIIVYEDNSSNFYIESFNLTDGSVNVVPVLIAPTIGSAVFNPIAQLCRGGLLLLGGSVYIGCASQDPEDIAWWGWLLKYDAVTLMNTQTWCVTCASGGSGGGIWWPPASDGTSIFVATGNGDWNGTTQFSESYVKLNTSLVVQDFFTPTNWAALNTGDTDLGSSRAMLIQGGAYLHGIGKDDRWWVVDTSNMGHLQSGGIGPVQEFVASVKFNNFTFGNNQLFYGDGGVGLLPWSGTNFSITSPVTFVNPTTTVNYGSGMSYTSNGSTAGTGLVWSYNCSASAHGNLVAGRLYAFADTTLVEKWNSGLAIGNCTKFVSPTVANGKVYVATQSNQIDVFGLPAAPPVILIGRK